MSSLIDSLNRILSNPFRVFIICLVLGAMAVTLDGSLYKYWSLSNSESELNQRIHRVTTDSQAIKSQIEKTKSLNFLERQARDRLDLVGQDEIVFVFSDDQ